MQRVSLHQQPTELHAIEQLPQSLDLAAAVGGVGALSDRDAEAVGIQAHLGDEARCASGVLGDRTPQGLAIADQGVDHFRHAWLRRDPLLQQGFKAFHIQLAQQPAEGRVRRRFGDVGAEELIERFAMAFGVGEAFSVRSNAPSRARSPGHSGSPGSPQAASTTAESARHGACGSPAAL